ncbi:hypothetical protein SAMN05216480_11626 [Pustulibacterium marinum]|uniref:Uncharacterized protein n=1 Tax=Pustulibacterium marinum TaxID=1224947 RepID=A0A1I7IGP1_9FLAO|nr:hypothetical protein [Pustulibacterium marinum]SFU72072.1 hypothetical protein SAMN05216480_11626 [Pustulibacterium marinum]
MTPKQDKTKLSKSLGLLTASIVAILIAISPFVFYSYIYVPSGPEWDTFFGTIRSDYYLDVNDLAWIFLGKLVPFYLLILWFLTCKHWWYHVILIPIAMYALQIFYVFNDEQQYFDEAEIYILVPIIAIIAPFVYLVRIKIFEKYIHGIDIKKIDEELEKYKETDSSNS